MLYLDHSISQEGAQYIDAGGGTFFFYRNLIEISNTRGHSCQLSIIFTAGNKNNSIATDITVMMSFQ